jgi:hypothetical protein
LQMSSQKVNDARAAFKKAQLQRDQLIAGKDGIRAIAKTVRNYIKGAFGYTSDEAKQIEGYYV